MKRGKSGSGRMTKAEEKRLVRKLVKKAFSLWTEVGRLAAHDRCEKCGMERGSVGDNGKPRYLDTHHIVVRDNHALRFNPRNCCALCHSCHKFGIEGAHRGTIVFSEWFRGHRPLDYGYLLEERGSQPVDGMRDVELAVSQLECVKLDLMRRMAGYDERARCE